MESETVRSTAKTGVSIGTQLMESPRVQSAVSSGVSTSANVAKAVMNSPTVGV